jgi:hypothetical protein
MPAGSILLTFLINWLVLFVACYVVTEYGHYYLYDGNPTGVAGKALAASLILAAVLTYTRTSFDTMLTTELGTTVIQGIIWFGVFIFVLRFHPLHALGLGLATMLLVAGLAGLGVDSLSRRNRPVVAREPSKAVRQAVPANPAPIGPGRPEPAKAP